MLVQVSPPDGLGRCSIGVGVDYLADALAGARVVIAEVNDHCPATAGEWIAWDRLDAVVHTSRPLLEAPAVEPGETERRIAAHVAEIVADGDTIQLGVGALPEAILSALTGHRDLGVHSGMVSDGILDLIEAGAVTGVSVTGAALGSVRLFDALHGREDIVFRPASYTHAPAVLAELRSLAAINSAVEIDLTGQVNSEVAGGRRIGAVGGQVDFLRAAAKPIIALPAKRIVARAERPGQHVAHRRRLGRHRARRALARRAVGHGPVEGAARARRRGGDRAMSDQSFRDAVEELLLERGWSQREIAAPSVSTRRTSPTAQAWLGSATRRRS